MTHAQDRDDRSDMDDDSVDLWSIYEARAAIDAYDAAKSEIETLVRAAAMTFAGKVALASPDFVDTYDIASRTYSVAFENAAADFVAQCLADLECSIQNFVDHRALLDARELAERNEP